jgi:DNA-binding transcriptional LysR family regulator
MNLKQLESFVWIARLGGFSAAAAKLHTSQPAISQRIHELEAELGVELINRSQKTLILTPKGRVCLEYAERVLNDASDLATHVCSKESIAGRARLGVGESIALTWLPQLLSMLGQEYPNLSVDLVVDLTKPLCRGLETGDFDVIILGGATPASQCVVVELGSAKLAWMAKPDFCKWSKAVTARDLQAFRILMLSQDTQVNRIAEDWFAKSGEHPVRRDVCNSMSILASLAMAGRGITLLPPLLFQREVEEGRLCIIPTVHPLEPIIYRAIYRSAHWPPFGRIIADLARRIAIFDSPGTAGRSARGLEVGRVE